MSFPKYEAYKDSGVEWLGEVPEHWATKQLKHVVHPKTSITYGIVQAGSEVEDGIPYIKTSDMSGDKLPLEGYSRTSPEIDASYQRSKVSAGDIVVAIRATVGKCLPVPPELKGANLTQGTAKVSPGDTVTANYLLLSMQSEPAQAYFDLMSKGATFKEITLDALRRTLLAYPPLSEQVQIARFLDHETARIDGLIAEQQRLIELLKEKRQAVISHAVTKGLDPTAPMKDSGVEWLGEVPAHWDICQNKYLLESVTSGSRGWAEFYSDDGYLFFRIANLTRDTVYPKLDSKQFVNPPIGSEGERSRIQIDDILISITADLGSVCVADSNIAGGYVSQHVALARPCRKKVLGRWLAYFVLSTACKEQLLGAGYGGTKIQLSLEDIKSFFVSVPSYQEQIQIAAFLDSEVYKFESLITEAVLGITLLQERRSALISAAVTGKIDVRGWQAPASAAPAPTLEPAH